MTKFFKSDDEVFPSDLHLWNMKEKMKWLSVFYALGDPQVLI
jgi:hypothetical protein